MVNEGEGTITFTVDHFTVFAVMFSSGAEEGEGIALWVWIVSGVFGAIGIALAVWFL